MSYNIHNPILTGMHPDPSICAVGEDFYLVNSTFEYFPGIPVFHSTDLLHWEQIGHVLSRPDQIELPKGAPNCIGIYAPTIRYHDGVFYCIVTNVGDKHGHGNFFCTTTDPYGEWSDPIWTDFEGIDPSIFFEDDGRMFYSGTDSSIYLCEMNPKTGERIGEKVHIWEGSGGNNPEGPHVYKINGMYYLMIAEGGTEAGHMETIARSENLFGPYESYEKNPVLTNRGTENPLKAIGHADLVQDCHGDWWAVCLCNRPLGYPFNHNLGRETCLVPVTWENGWPVMGEQTHVNQKMVVEREPLPNKLDGTRYIACSDVFDDFTADGLHPSWNYVYTPQEGLVELVDDGLKLHGNEVPISADEKKAILLRRQEHFCVETEVRVMANPSEDGMETGFGVYMNPAHHYEVVFGRYMGKAGVYLKRQLESMKTIENFVPYSGVNLTFKMRSNRKVYEFFFVDEQGTEHYMGAGECRKITTECGGCFTGNYLHLYATNMSAKFTQYSYKGITEEENF